MLLTTNLWSLLDSSPSEMGYAEAGMQAAAGA